MDTPTDTITLTREEYERLLEAAESDDAIVWCERCGAWMTRDEAAPVEDVIGCWRWLLDRPNLPCFSHRGTKGQGA